ncbi:hypothetical protein JJV70_19250 [Streptomyces sp. JJ66]|uniref:hypothetical protein n=1 Tax=Streptomyces sp. JJ66 TaxID=2803843 RepID=UPI001C561B4C|nr:hypothetical protein [Streptomyces sp. JJ66]MBW1604197.1 hypothetical protein [Streptomyces sp. JJ66]
MSAPIPPVPTGPVHACPWGYVGTAVQRALLLEALHGAGVELGEYDTRIVDWLAGWDWPTVVVIVSWLHRADRTGGPT